MYAWVLVLLTLVIGNFQSRVFAEDSCAKLLTIAPEHQSILGLVPSIIKNQIQIGHLRREGPSNEFLNFKYNIYRVQEALVAVATQRDTEGQAHGAKVGADPVRHLEMHQWIMGTNPNAVFVAKSEFRIRIIKGVDRTIVKVFHYFADGIESTSGVNADQITSLLMGNIKSGFTEWLDGTTEFVFRYIGSTD